MELAAVILAGGTAARLDGVDKGSLEHGGTTFLERALEATREVGEVVVVGDPVPTTRPVTFVREDPPLGGPVAALVAGRRALGRVAAGLSGLVSLAPVVWSAVSGAPVWLPLAWHAPALVTAVVAVAAFHREAPAPSRVWWAVAPVAVAAGVASVVFTPWLSTGTLLAAWLIAAVVAAAFRPWSARTPVPAT